MKKRLIALFLCSALIFGMLPTVINATSSKLELTACSGGKAVQGVELAMDGTVSVNVTLNQSAVGNFQWQINMNGVWANILGVNGDTLTLRYAMVANALNGAGQATVRCRFTPAEGEAVYSDNVIVQMTPGGVSTMDLTADDYQRPDPVILDPGSVVVHTPVEETVPETSEATEPSVPESSEATEPSVPESSEATEPSVPESSEATEPSVPETSEATEPSVPESSEATETMSLASFLGLDTFVLEASAAEVENDNVKETYNIVVNYMLGGKQVATPYTATLAKGEAFSVTITFPTVQGYLPYLNDVQQNGLEINIPSVSENVTYNVIYKPTNVNYTVIHYKQNVDNDQYTEDKRETKQGLTESQVPEVAKVYEKADGTMFAEDGYQGFYSLIYERPNIAADGSTVIEIYYDRYYYLMNFDMDGGFGTEPIYARYGAPIDKLTEPTKAGYKFDGWAETKGGTTKVDLPKTMPAESKTYYAIWTPEDTAKVTVVFWGENADDEGYSYLADQTKVINLKPGREFTYSEKEMLVCDKDVHTHNDDCLGCGKTEHTHSAVGGSCYTLTCTVESHTHGKDCYGTDIGAAFSISLSEHWVEGNQVNGTIGESYYTYIFGSSGTGNKYIYIDGTWYKYSGSTAIGSVVSVSCGKQESTHTHTNTCYTLTCTTEEHNHNEKCYTCGKEQHTHNSDCYMQGAGLDTTKWKFVKSDTITVAADGSSVVNVYYDRVEYSVQFYDGRGNSEYTDIKITAKWGAYIGDKWPTKNNSGTWAVNPSNGNSVSGPYQVYLQEMPVGGDKFYGPKTDSGTQSAYYYVEVLPGETGTETYNNKSYKLHHTDTSPGSGYVVTDDDKYAIQGFTFVGFTAERNNSGNYRYNGAKFYYTRNSYKLTFNDQYNDVKNETVKFEAPLSTYKDYVPEVPSQFEPGSVEFGGWYQNPQCTGEEYKLADHKMPANDIILYAKWVPVNHTVTFYLDKEAYDAGTKLDTHPAITVPHGQLADSTPAAPTKGSYEFIGWFYMDGNQEKAFDFANMQVRKDLDVYGKWSSNTLEEYTVQHVLKDDHSVKVADDLKGSGLAGTTKTFDAKGGTDLYAAYQEGYFPTVQSQSLLLDIESDSLVVTFEYVPMPAVPYTVKYINTETNTNVFDGVTVEDKHVENNKKAVVTETFKPISGYMPDAYQKRLVVTADGENILYFYYTKDGVHAMYIVKHFTQNTDGTTWTEYATSSAQGDIGKRYTASPMTIPGFTYVSIDYTRVVDDKTTVVTDVTADGAELTAEGLQINLYYVRNPYPYQVRYLEQGSGKQLAYPKNGTGKYGEIISESAISIEGYEAVEPTSATLNIRIDEGEGAPMLNIITFYYKEKELTINYVAVGPEGATDFGSVDPTTETVKVISGTAKGSTPTAGTGFKFVGWYENAACTQPVAEEGWLNGDKITPNAQGIFATGNLSTTYYAKFEYDVADLTISKSGWAAIDENQSFIFDITGPDGYKNRVVICGNGSVTIKGLKIGQYTVTEVQNWSWRYDATNPTNGSLTQTISAVNPVTFAFTNSRNRQYWLSGDAYKNNHFGS